MIQLYRKPVAIQSATTPRCCSGGYGNYRPGRCLHRFFNNTMRPSCANRTTLACCRMATLITTPWKKKPLLKNVRTQHNHASSQPSMAWEHPPARARAPPPCVAKAHVTFCVGQPTPSPSPSSSKNSKLDGGKMCAIYMLESSNISRHLPDRTHIPRNLTNVNIYSETQRVKSAKLAVGK